MIRGFGAALTVLAALVFANLVTASDAVELASYEPGELLVSFERSATPAARADVVSDLDARIVERLPVSNLVRVRLDPHMSVTTAKAAFERRSAVRYAQPNHRYQLLADPPPNDPGYLADDLWGLFRIHAPEAWDLSTGSNSLTVAVVDSGVKYTHPDLSANIWLNTDEFGGNSIDDDANGFVDDVRGWNFAPGINPTNDPDDEDGHGTHVAGTIGATGNNGVGVTGVNWNVKVMALRAGGASLSDLDIGQAFQYACANGAKVINGSFGGPDFSQVMLDRINACPGSLFVFSAGNGDSNQIGVNNDVTPVYPCNLPAANIVCVAATTSNDLRASFSNYGASTVDLAAPGVDILSTWPASLSPFADYAYLHGTSMASPHVAGAAALVWTYRPTLTVAELKRNLMNSVDPLASLQGVVASGGRLNVFRAMTQELLPPTGLSAQSLSPSFNNWSNLGSAVASWGGATDGSGIDGYSFGWSPDANFAPDEAKDVEENVTTTSTNLPDGRHWFHVRARDGAGNWGDPVHLGPFLVDTFPAARPTLSSPSHRAGIASTDRTVEINWMTLGDSVSGMDGFSFAWSRQRLVTVDTTKEVEEGIVRTTSPSLDPGAWWFGIRARDNAGNWTDPTVLGPFVITGVTPACTVPRLRGLTVVGARRSLTKAGCALGRTTRTYSKRVRRGRVVGQRPGPGLKLRRGTKIAVVVSRGRRKR